MRYVLYRKHASGKIEYLHLHRIDKRGSMIKDVSDNPHDVPNYTESEAREILSKRPPYVITPHTPLMYHGMSEGYMPID